MSYSTPSPPIEIFTADEAGRRRHWSDEDKLRIVEESYRGVRQGSATARRYGISRSLLSIWRRELRQGSDSAAGDTPVFTPLMMEAGAGSSGIGSAERSTPDRIDLSLRNGRRISFSPALAPEVLARILNVVDPL
ncbi:transposase [Falsigemmobacter intermedius]|uniref:Transposase n=1 Tax=Falsigemmobacter intermedius TaxID=1553448 RepID=A0A451GG38_9RHOB|nr:transposase [Falsigemmobacter intermedius]RWY33925.1 transposase [Falsigemmobacter intermedius]